MSSYILRALSGLLRDPGYVLRYSDHGATPLVKVFAHSEPELVMTDRIRRVSITGKGPIGYPRFSPMPRIVADAASGQPSVLFDRNAITSPRLVTWGPVNPARRGALTQQPATAWDTLLALRSVVVRA